jgi:DNA-binding response OmpR family regulator
MKSDLWLAHAASYNFSCLQAGDITLYPESHEIFIKGSSVQCSPTHFCFLEKLLADYCKTVSYERLMQTGGRALRPGERKVLLVQIYLLRRWLLKHNAHIEIRNVYARGYQARPR